MRMHRESSIKLEISKVRRRRRRHDNDADDDDIHFAKNMKKGKANFLFIYIFCIKAFIHSVTYSFVCCLLYFFSLFLFICHAWNLVFADFWRSRAHRVFVFICDAWHNLELHCAADDENTKQKKNTTTTTTKSHQRSCLHVFADIRHKITCNE